MKKTSISFCGFLCCALCMCLLFSQCEKDKQFNCGTSTIVDVDGNTYTTVKIGNQCWMKENLRTTKYADGTSIAEGSSASTDEAYWYYPDSNSANKAIYGLLYNWKAVMRNTSSSSSNPSHVQGICPDGWHVPSDEEWTQLTDYVRSQSQYCCLSDTAYIAKALASTTGWSPYSGTSTEDQCCPGYNSNSNNATGFSAFPAGYFYEHCSVFGYSTNLWSVTENGSDHAYYRYLNYNDPNVHRDYCFKKCGLSVRCLRD